jgi:uncharacterized protein (TIGR04255 family)
MIHDFVNTFPHLPNAPITEAIIDLRAELASEISIDDLALFQAGIGDRFSKRTERRSFKTRIEIQDNAPTVQVPESKADGYVFTSPSEQLIAQARLDGFTLSRIKPYHTGDKFMEEARELWKRYLQVARPKKVTRLAVRNVNRIEMEPGSPIERYILTGPEIARSLPQVLEGFFLRLMLPDASGAHAIITETFGEVVPETQIIPLIFDIDAFREIDLEPNDADIWQVISELRALKNRIFFNSLTAQCLEAYR